MHTNIQENIKDILLIETISILLEYRKENMILDNIEIVITDSYVSKQILNNSKIINILENNSLSKIDLSETLNSYLGHLSNHNSLHIPFCTLDSSGENIKISYTKCEETTTDKNIYTDEFKKDYINTLNRIFKKSNKEYFFNMDKNNLALYLLIYDFDKYSQYLINSARANIKEEAKDEVYDIYLSELSFFQHKYFAEECCEQFKKIVSKLEDKTPPNNIIKHMDIDIEKKYNYNWIVVDDMMRLLEEEVDLYEK